MNGVSKARRKRFPALFCATMMANLPDFRSMAMSIIEEWEYHNTCWISYLIIFLPPLYVLLSLAALASRFIPFLKVLSSHGKTFQQQQPTYYWTVLGRSIGIINISISKRYFAHFYIIGLLSLYGIQYLFCGNSSYRLSVPTSIVHLLLTIHLVRRLYECHYVHQWNHGRNSSDSSRMYLAGYLLGILHYLILPLVFVQEEEKEQQNRYCHQNVQDDNEACHSRSTMVQFNCLALIGMGLNLWAQYEQYQHHSILADLRRKKPSLVDSMKKDHHHHHHPIIDTTTTSTSLSKYRYAILPNKRWFQYVACPHYLAEILIYFSLVVVWEQDRQSSKGTFKLLLQPAGGTYLHPIDDLSHSYVISSTFSFLALIWNFTTGRSNTTTILDAKNALFSLLRSLQPYTSWFLVAWVATNLSVSALNNFDWYHHPNNHHYHYDYDSAPTISSSSIISRRRRPSPMNPKGSPIPHERQNHPFLPQQNIPTYALIPFWF